MFIKTYVDNKACVSFGNFFFVFLFFQHSRRDLCEGRGTFSYLLLTRVRTGKVLRPRGQVFLVLLNERKFEVDLAPAIYRYYHVLKSQTLSNFEIYALYGNFLIKNSSQIRSRDFATLWINSIKDSNLKSPRDIVTIFPVMLNPSV